MIPTSPQYIIQISYFHSILDISRYHEVSISNVHKYLDSIEYRTSTSLCLHMHSVYVCVNICSMCRPVGQCMQTRHNFEGEIRIFSVKIRINPYPSFMHRFITKTSRDSYRDAVCKQIATLCNKNRQPWQQHRTKIGV